MLIMTAIFWHSKVQIGEEIDAAIAVSESQELCIIVDVAIETNMRSLYLYSH